MTAAAALRAWWRPAPQAADASQAPPGGPGRAGCSSTSSQGGGGGGYAPRQPAGRCPASTAGGASEERRGEQTHVTVQELPGQLLQVSGAARVALPAHQVFALLTHPSNERIFRHLQACNAREVLEDGGPGGVTVVESEHVATWRLLMFSGTLETRLRVEQRPREGRVHFSLLPSRFHFMRRFSGEWRVEAAAPAGAAEQPQHAVLTLKQEAQPAVYLPPPLGGLFRSIACQQLVGIFEDIQAEAARIRRGRPTLWQAE